MTDFSGAQAPFVCAACTDEGIGEGCWGGES